MFKPILIAKLEVIFLSFWCRNSVVNYWNMLKSSDINVIIDQAFKKKIASFL